MRLILNLGCGSKTSAHPDVVNVDWSITLYIRKNPFLRGIAPLLLDGERLARLKSLPSNIVVHDLRKRIPFDSDSADAVYHSHVLEHFDRDVAPGFLSEITRVLKPGGIHRIVVPDLETQCREYLNDLEACAIDASQAGRHDESVAALLEQSVRREASGTSRQKPLRRRLENLLLGDARTRGETHQWMYDRVNLTSLLSRLGYRNIRVQTHQRSYVPDWEEIGLDMDAHGREYKPDSLYVEAIK